VTSRRALKDRILIGLTFVCVVIAIVPLATILYYVTVRGLPAISLEFFTKVTPPPSVAEGMGNAVQGTLLLVGLATCIGIPFGVLSGVYISEYGKNLFGRTVRFFGDVLVGNPSIVFGLLVAIVIVSPTHGYSVVAGSVALGTLMIPIVTVATAEALKMVPNSIREASTALGVRKWRTSLLVVSNAKSGVATGALLATARIMGETAPLLLTAGSSTLWYNGLWRPVASLPSYIYLFGISPFPDWITLAWGAAFILIVIVMGINITVRMLTRRRSDAGG
jgi:phosphate transport system permease protein